MVFETRPVVVNALVERVSRRTFVNDSFVGLWVFDVDPVMLYEGALLNVTSFAGYEGLRFTGVVKLHRVSTMPGAVKSVYRVG